MKEFAPDENQFFPYREDPFCEWTFVQKIKQEAIKVVSLVQNDDSSSRKYTYIILTPSNPISI